MEGAGAPFTSPPARAPLSPVRHVSTWDGGEGALCSLSVPSFENGPEGASPGAVFPTKGRLPPGLVWTALIPGERLHCTAEFCYGEELDSRRYGHASNLRSAANPRLVLISFPSTTMSFVGACVLFRLPSIVCTRRTTSWRTDSPTS